MTTEAKVIESIDISAIRYLNKHYFDKIKSESLKERAVFKDLRNEIEAVVATDYISQGLTDEQFEQIVECALELITVTGIPFGDFEMLSADMKVEERFFETIKVFPEIRLLMESAEVVHVYQDKIVNPS